MSLTREEIEQGIEKIERTQKVPIPELGGDVFVLMLSAEQRDAFDRSLFDKDGNPTQENLGGRLACLTLSNVDGMLLYGNDDPKTVAALMAEWPTPIVERIFQAARNFNLMKKGDIEDAAKNSGKTPPVSSSTD